MNKWIGMGRPTKDPEIKRNQDGKSVARFTLAVDRKYKKEGSQTADFISCVAFDKTAEFVDKYVQKGRRYLVDGHIQTGSYTNRDGQKVYTTDVMVDGIEFADSKGDVSSSGNGSDKVIKAVANNSKQSFIDVPEGVEDEGLPFN